MKRAERPGLTRRQFVRRAAALGTLAWSAPLVSSFRVPAHAQASPEPTPTGSSSVLPRGPIRRGGGVLTRTGIGSAELAAAGVGAVGAGVAAREAARRRKIKKRDAAALQEDPAALADGPANVSA